MNKKLGVFLLIGLLSLGTKAEEHQRFSRCQKYFLNVSSFFKSKKGPISKYLKQVKETKGLRLLVKDNDLENAPILSGFFSPKPRPMNNRVFRFFQKGKNFLAASTARFAGLGRNYIFTPGNGIIQTMFDLPLNYISNKYFEKDLIFTRVAKFPAVISLGVASGVTWYLGAQKTEVEYHRLYQIEHRDDYIYAIENDFRYKEIRTDLELSNISEEEALNLAYNLTIAYSDYYHYRDENVEILSEGYREELLNHYLFSDMVPILSAGVRKTRGFNVEENDIGDLTHEQVNELFRNRHQLLFEHQVILDADNIQELLFIDPVFALNLFELYQKEYISWTKLQYYMQENSAFKARLDSYKIIGIERYLEDENGRYTESFLELSDIQAEIINEILATNTP